jgi:hypothetical protein
VTLVAAVKRVRLLLLLILMLLLLMMMMMLLLVMILLLLLVMILLLLVVVLMLLMVVVLMQLLPRLAVGVRPVVESVLRPGGAVGQHVRLAETRKKQGSILKPFSRLRQ